jgi:hypothetical protein
MASGVPRDQVEKILAGSHTSIGPRFLGGGAEPGPDAVEDLTKF